MVILVGEKEKVMVMTSEKWSELTMRRRARDREASWCGRKGQHIKETKTLGRTGIDFCLSEFTHHSLL